MLITSDGRQFVFGVFGADGHECESLEAVFASVDEAVKYKAEVQSRAETHGEEVGRPWKCSDCYGDPDLLHVEMLELGKKRDVLNMFIVG